MNHFQFTRSMIRGTTIMMRAALVCALAVVLTPTSINAAERLWRVGVLALAYDGIFQSVMQPLLRDHGLVEGRDYIVDLRVGTDQQLPQLAQVLASSKPDVIIAGSDWAVRAARSATRTIPIIAAPLGSDPVKSGFAQSWARPGGNVSGVCLIAPELEVKRLSLLREALPSVRRIAVLANHRETLDVGMGPLRIAAAQSGSSLREIWVTSPEDYGSAIETLKRENIEALIVIPTPELNRDTEKIGELAMKSGIPTIGGFRDSAKKGFLIGYGPSVDDLGRQATDYLERIFNGATPENLPFQGPTRIEFAVNLRVARDLHLSIPPDVVARASDVID